MSARQAVSDLLSALARARLPRYAGSSRASTPRRSCGFVGERRRGVCTGARREGTPRGARTASRRHRRHRASRSAQSANNSASRRSCAAAATAVAFEIGARSPRAAFHRESAKLVVAAVGARPGGTRRVRVRSRDGDALAIVGRRGRGASADGMATVGQQMANAFGFGGSEAGEEAAAEDGARWASRGGSARRASEAIDRARALARPSPRSSVDVATRVVDGRRRAIVDGRRHTETDARRNRRTRRRPRRRRWRCGRGTSPVTSPHSGGGGGRGGGVWAGERNQLAEKLSSTRRARAFARLRRVPSASPRSRSTPRGTASRRTSTENRSCTCGRCRRRGDRFRDSRKPPPPLDVRT